MNALYPRTAGDASAEPPLPGPRLYHPPTLPHLEDLKRRLESEWGPELQRTLRIAADELPLLWDCDFLHGERANGAEERYVLCEINVSSVAPFPDSAIEPLVLAVRAVQARIDARRPQGSTPG